MYYAIQIRSWGKSQQNGGLVSRPRLHVNNKRAVWSGPKNSGEHYGHICITNHDTSIGSIYVCSAF